MTQKLIPAVGYARRSTDMQERSIPEQQAFVERWAAEHGYRILRWFIDDAISGTSTRGRDAFERMIAAAENGRDFDTILCYDISRFSRGGTNETGYYLHRLHLAGVNVVFTTEDIPEGDEGELIQGVKSWQARRTRRAAHHAGQPEGQARRPGSTPQGVRGFPSRGHQ